MLAGEHLAGAADAATALRRRSAGCRARRRARAGPARKPSAAARGSRLRPGSARSGSPRLRTAARCARTACGCSRAPPCPGRRPRTAAGTDSGYGTCVTPGIVGAKPFCCVYLLEVNASEPMRAAVEAAEEADEARTPGDVARELDRALDRLPCRTGRRSSSPARPSAPPRRAARPARVMLSCQ